MKNEINLQGSIADLQEALQDGQELNIANDAVKLWYRGIILAAGKEDVAERLEEEMESC